MSVQECQGIFPEADFNDQGTVIIEIEMKAITHTLDHMDKLFGLGCSRQWEYAVCRLRADWQVLLLRNWKWDKECNSNVQILTDKPIVEIWIHVRPQSVHHAVAASFLNAMSYWNQDLSEKHFAVWMISNLYWMEGCAKNYAEDGEGFAHMMSYFDGPFLGSWTVMLQVKSEFRIILFGPRLILFSFVC